MFTDIFLSSGLQLAHMTCVSLSQKHGAPGMQRKRKRFSADQIEEREKEGEKISVTLRKHLVRGF